jgi:hypothetical protein
MRTRWLYLPVSELQRLDETLLRKLVRIALNHQHIPLVAVMGRIDYEFAIDLADPYATDRPSHGMSEHAKAADAPLTIKISDSFSPSAEKKMPITCTSFLNPLGNSGRKGRSYSRDVKISFSEGFPSRFP